MVACREGVGDSVVEAEGAAGQELPYNLDRICFLSSEHLYSIFVCQQCNCSGEIIHPDVGNREVWVVERGSRKEVRRVDEGSRA